TPEEYARAKGHKQIVTFYEDKKNALVRLLNEYLNASSKNSSTLIFKANGMHAVLSADLELIREPLDAEGNTIVHILASHSYRDPEEQQKVSVLAQYLQLMGITQLQVYAALRNKKNQTPIEIAYEVNNIPFLYA